MNQTHIGPHPWMARIACKDEDPELFFPFAAAGTPAWQEQVDKATDVCDRCPVALECLDRALREGYSDGVFAGLTPAQRTALRPLWTEEENEAPAQVRAG